MFFEISLLPIKIALDESTLYYLCFLDGCRFFKEQSGIVCHFISYYNFFLPINVSLE